MMLFKKVTQGSPAPSKNLEKLTATLTLKKQ
jgi:hypothetical protein